MFARTNEEFISELKSLGRDDLIPLTEYINECTHVRFECTVCGHRWWNTPGHILHRGQGCPVCRSSKNEKRINSFLKANDIRFIPQKEFDGLVGDFGLPLSYDFYLPDNNLLIEYQGEFHDGNVRCQSDEELEIRQDYDDRKRAYAKEHDIKLLEIWYYDKDRIEEILSEYLGISEAA